MRLIGCIVACQPKQKKNGFKLTVIDDLGLQQCVHAFDNYAYCCDFKSVWQIEVQKHDGFNKGFTFSFFTLVGKPRQIGSLDNSFRDVIPEFLSKPVYTVEIYNGIQRYQANPKNIKQLDRAYVSDRLDTVVADVNSIHKGSCTQWLSTFKEDNQLREREGDALKEFSEALQIKEKSYGNRVNYYKRPSNDSLEESLATLCLKKEGHDDITVNTFPKTGLQVPVDSIVAQVAFREKEVAEFYTYFALITLLKRSHHYPVTKVGVAIKYLSKFLNTYRRKKVKTLIAACAKAGFLKITDNPRFPEDLRDDQELSILSQQEYVRKHEAAYNARARNATKQYGIGIKKIGRKRGVDAYIPYKEIPQTDGKILPHIKHQDLYRIYRPYFTIYAYRTANLDTGFIHLLNAPNAEMRAFLYELVVTSYNQHPVCRTILGVNLGISKNTQLLYERANMSLEKRTNHTEIPEDMLNALSHQARDKIFEAVQVGGKFKRSKSGKIYRQEGNSYKSQRIKWISSPKTARLKLSRRIINLWRAIEPIYREGFSEPSMQEVPRELLGKEKLRATYVTTKKALKTVPYFAFLFAGVIIPTVNRKHWKGFEPLERYDRASGDRILPSQPSLYDLDERISRVERDVVLAPTNLLKAPVRVLELSSHVMR